MKCVKDGKKRDKSLSVNLKKSLTPKIVFKKLTSPNKNTKKKQLSPFNRSIERIIKKNCESKKSVLPSQGSVLLKDENPVKVSKVKMKKNPIKDRKEPKRKLTQVKAKGETKNVTKGKKEDSIKSIVKKQPPKVIGQNKKVITGKSSKEMPEKPKNNRINNKQKQQKITKKDAKCSKKTSKKAERTLEIINISSSGRSAKEIPEKPRNIKTITKKHDKGSKKESKKTDEVLEIVNILSSGAKKRKKSSSGPEIQNKKYVKLEDHEAYSGAVNNDACSEKVNENDVENLIKSCPEKELSEEPSSPVSSENDVESLIKSCPEKQLSEEPSSPVFYAQGEDDGDSLGFSSEVEHPDVNGVSGNISPLLPTSGYSIDDDAFEEYDASSDDDTNAEAHVESESIDEENIRENKKSDDDDIIEEAHVDPESEAEIHIGESKKSDDVDIIEEAHVDSESEAEIHIGEFKKNDMKTEYFKNIDNNNARNKTELWIEDSQINTKNVYKFPNTCVEINSQDKIVVPGEILGIHTECKDQLPEKVLERLTKDKDHLAGNFSQINAEDKDQLFEENSQPNTQGEDQFQEEGLETIIEDKDQSAEIISQTYNEDKGQLSAENSQPSTEGEDQFQETITEDKDQSPVKVSLTNNEDKDQLFKENSQIITEKEDQFAEKVSFTNIESSSEKWFLFSEEDSETNIEEKSQFHKDTSPSNTEGRDQFSAEVSKPNIPDELLPEGVNYTPLVSAAENNKSPKRSIIEDDLFLSTTESHCSSLSTVSSSSVDEFNKIKKYKNKMLGSPSTPHSKIKKDMENIGKTQNKRKYLNKSGDSSTSSDLLLDEFVDHPKKRRKIKLGESPQHSAGLESPRSRTSETSSCLSPIKDVKVVLRRLEQTEYHLVLEDGVVHYTTLKKDQIQDSPNQLKPVNKQDLILEGKDEDKNNTCRDLIKDCSVVLAKVDYCTENDMKHNFHVSQTTDLTKQSISSPNIVHATSPEINHQIKPRLSEKVDQDGVFNNSTSPKHDFKSQSLNLSVPRLKKAARTYSRSVNEQKPSTKVGSRVINSSESNLQGQPTFVTEENIMVNAPPAKRAKICKADILQRRKAFLKNYDKSKQNFNCTPSKTVKVLRSEEMVKSSSDISVIKTSDQQGFDVEKYKAAPDKTPNINQVGNIKPFVRRVINNANIPKLSPEQTFKQPQAYQKSEVHKKVHARISFMDDKSSRKESNYNLGIIKEKPVPDRLNSCEISKVISNKSESFDSVHPSNQILNKSHKNVLPKEELGYGSINLMDQMPQCHSHTVEEDDDTESLISIAVAPDLENFINKTIGETTEAEKYVRGNTCKNRITLQNSLSTLNCEPRPSTSYGEKFPFNKYSNVPQKQQDAFHEANPFAGRKLLKSDQNQLGNTKVNNNQKKFNCDLDKNEESDEEEEYTNQMRPLNRDKEVQQNNNLSTIGVHENRQTDEFRRGNPSKINLMDNQIETGFPQSRSRSSSSPSSTNNLYSSDLCENILIGTIFEGYCLSYFRNSVARNQDHPCGLRHEVPPLLSQRINNTQVSKKRHIIYVLRKVCYENCNNPPLELLDKIVEFCIKNEQRNDLEFVIARLKRSISVGMVGDEKYKEIWTGIANSLLINIVQIEKPSNPEMTINIFLEKIIFDKNVGNDKQNLMILHEVLGLLARLSETTPSLKLLYCITFLTKDLKHPVNLYPISFIEAVLNQVLKKNKFGNGNDKSVNSFLFKVYKTFFVNYEDCRYIYRKNRSLTEEFLNAAMFIDDVKCKLTQLRGEFGSVREQNNPRMRNIHQPISEPIHRQADNTRVPNHQMSLAANHSPDMLTKQVQLIGEVTDMKKIFNTYKLKGASYYLNMLKQCKDPNKKKLNSVTMSFILLESENDKWDNCYSLLKEMNDCDPLLVQDFTNKNNTQARRLLVIINCCLKTHHIEEAVDWFLRYRLFETDESKWQVEASLDDIDTWKQLCENMQEAFCHLTRFTNAEATLFTSIIRHQKSLTEPIHLQVSLNRFLWEAVNLPAEGGKDAIFSIIEAIAMGEIDLLKKFNVDLELYRLLIRLLIRNTESLTDISPAICARLMRKANTNCINETPIYPTSKSWAKESNEVTFKTCLTEEELYSFFIFKIRSFKKLLELKSLHFVFEEYVNNPNYWKHYCYKEVDCSIRGATERFKAACKSIGLEPNTLIINGNKITVDKVMLQETLQL